MPTPLDPHLLGAYLEPEDDKFDPGKNHQTKSCTQNGNSAPHDANQVLEMRHHWQHGPHALETTEYILILFMFAFSFPYNLSKADAWVLVVRYIYLYTLITKIN